MPLGPGSDRKGQHLRDHLANLRRKLDDRDGLLVSEPGMRYRFVIPAQADLNLLAAPDKSRLQAGLIQR